jgi:hypothetical protein
VRDCIVGAEIFGFPEIRPDTVLLPESFYRNDLLRLRSAVSSASIFRDDSVFLWLYSLKQLYHEQSKKTITCSESRGFHSQQDTL